MFCHFCGARLEASASFCPSCGRQIGGVPLMPAQGRIASHIRPLGILWLAMSALHLLPALFMFSMFGGHGPSLWFPGPPAVALGFVRVLGMVCLAGGILGIIAGWGLLERQPWARMLAIVLGVINLIHIPFGTLLGIYTLWVLLPAESEHEYRRIARAA